MQVAPPRSFDPSALGLTNETSTILDKGGVCITTTNTGDFFNDNGNFAVAFEDDGTNTRIYVDANNDGNFTLAADMVIEVTGLPPLDVSDLDFIV